MTSTIQAVEEVIKTDVRGRVRTSGARRESLLAEFEKSGLSAAQFAKLAGIKYQTFANWLQKRRRQAAGQGLAQPTDPVRWLEAVVQEAQGTASGQTLAVVVSLPGGARMELSQVKQIPLAHR